MKTEVLTENELGFYQLFVFETSDLRDRVYDNLHDVTVSCFQEILASQQKNFYGGDFRSAKPSTEPLINSLLV